MLIEFFQEPGARLEAQSPGQFLHLGGGLRHRVQGAVVNDPQSALNAQQEVVTGPKGRLLLLFEQPRRAQGRQTEARDLVGPVYGWFTEGFDAEDLKEAKALADELS